MQAAARFAGRAPEELTLPEVPACVSGLHTAWHQLAAARQSGMGRSPLAWSEIAAWQQLMGLRLNPWEVETISAMDRAALAVPSAK